MENRENVFDRFRRNSKVLSDCNKRKTAYFIKNHESSTTVKVVRTEEEIPAVLVYSHKEGADEVLLYVSSNDDVTVGDYFV